MKKILILTLFMFSTQSYSKVLATVGASTITTDDVKRFRTHLIYSGAPAELVEDQSTVLDYIINVKLAVMDLKNTGLDQANEAKDSVDGALYNYYLRKNADMKLRNKKFSNQEINAYYKKYPVIKLQRLALPFIQNNDASKKDVFSKMSAIRSEIRNKKTTFEAVIEKYSKNDPTTLTGTFDKVPSSILSTEEKESVNTTPLMDVSSILTTKNYFSIIRVIKIYPISSGDYLPINEILKANATSEARGQQVKALRQKYSSVINIK